MVGFFFFFFFFCVGLGGGGWGRSRYSIRGSNNFYFCISLWHLPVELFLFRPVYCLVLEFILS